MISPLSKKPGTRWLIIPMEIIERELYGNLLLCTEAVSQGWQCIIGTKRSIIASIPHLPPGVAFLKSIVSSDMHNIRPFKAAGNRVVSLDVEGLVYTSMEEFVSCRFARETMKETDFMFFWGDVQRNAVASAYPDQARKLLTTGTPIADLWIRRELHTVYKRQVDDLKARFGPYILLPSSFGTANHYMGYKAAQGIIERDKLIQAGEQDRFLEFWGNYEAHMLKMFRAFLALLPKVSAAFPDHKIIVRPHPSESHKTWKEAAEGLPNVEVLFEGIVSPWLLGADAILHYGCTTGLEGYLMGRPVVAYNPSTEEEKAKYDHILPHSVSLIGKTGDETIALLREVIANPRMVDTLPHIAEGRKMLADYILQTEDGAAAEIMKHLGRLDLPRTILGAVPPINIPLREKIWALLAVLAKPRWIKSALPPRIKLGLESRAYGRHKTRTINDADLEKTFALFAQIKNVKGAKAEKLAENLYYLGKD